jgi:uncharacterized membrane protein YoaK (UPF0700 family)
MPIFYLRRLTGRERAPGANHALARYLAFVAGATNAGGYLAVQQYTSHMSGIVSAAADNLALGEFALVLAALGSLLSFVCGAACSAVMINWARRNGLASQYACPLVVEALLLAVFGLIGGNLDRHMGLFVSLTVMLLCFIMGLQNAMITKLSKAEIRTTHMTGMVTDIGIELGKLLYWNSSRHGEQEPPVRADRAKMRLLGSLLALFFCGGVAGALGFKHLGFIATLPLALLLLLLAIVPVADDLARVWRPRA